MKKIKISTIMITIMLISISAVSISGEGVLEGNIEVETTEYLGIVKPKMNLSENQSISLDVSYVKDDNSTNATGRYMVNDTLMISLNITDNCGRNIFLVQRSIIVGVIISRKFADITLSPILPITGLFRRFFPVISIVPATVIPGLLNRQRDNYVNITMNYEIDNSTLSDGENLTMNIFIVGFLPGDVNGFDILPIVDYKQINLAVEYQE